VHGVSHTTAVLSLRARYLRLVIHHAIAFRPFVPVSPKIVIGSLYRRRVKHDADGGTEGLGRQVVLELGADDAGVAVRADDLALFVVRIMVSLTAVLAFIPR
jgi:hypothetical protein